MNKRSTNKPTTWSTASAESANARGHRATLIVSESGRAIAASQVLSSTSSAASAPRSLRGERLRDESQGGHAAAAVRGPVRCGPQHRRADACRVYPKPRTARDPGTQMFKPGLLSLEHRGLVERPILGPPRAHPRLLRKLSQTPEEIEGLERKMCVATSTSANFSRPVTPAHKLGDHQVFQIMPITPLAPGGTPTACS